MKDWQISPCATEKDRLTINRLAREQMKLRLLADIRMDLEICRLEGWDCIGFLNELKEIIDGFLSGD